MNMRRVFLECRIQRRPQMRMTRCLHLGLPPRATLSAIGVLLVLIATLTIMMANTRAQGFRAAIDKEGGAPMSEKSITLTVLYNNAPHDQRLTTAWGMACLVEGAVETVLFDTGDDGSVLLRNMKALGKSPADVTVVVLSHIHADHMGGLAEFLKQNSLGRRFSGFRLRCADHDYWRVREGSVKKRCKMALTRWRGG